jgi:hypothetical protein
MYIMIKVMGRPLTGPSATSHAFFSLSVSISSCVGGFRGWAFESFCFYENWSVDDQSGHMLSSMPYLGT